MEEEATGVEQRDAEHAAIPYQNLTRHNSTRNTAPDLLHPGPRSRTIHKSPAQFCSANSATCCGKWPGPTEILRTNRLVPEGELEKEAAGVKQRDAELRAYQSQQRCKVPFESFLPANFRCMILWAFVAKS